MELILNTITFPLQGKLANLCLGLESLIIFICGTITLLFLWQYLNASQNRRNARNFVWSIIFFGFGGAYFIYLFGDYSNIDMNTRNGYTIYAYVILALGLQIAVILSELLDKPKRHPFTIIGGVNLSLILILLITKANWIVYPIILLGIPSGVIFLIYYIQRLYILADRSKELQKKIMTFFGSMLAIIFGYLFISDFLINHLGLGIRLLGDLMVLFGLHLFVKSLDDLPDFGEFEWIHSIRAIVVVHNNGIPLFSRFWKSDKGQSELSNIDKETLISGAMNTVEIILNEMVGNERLNRIQMQDKVVLFERRENFMTMIIATDYFESLAIRAKHFSDNFQQMFGALLPNWGGNTQLFAPAEVITDRHFIPRA